MAYGPALRIEGANCCHIESLGSEESVRSLLLAAVTDAGMTLMDIPGNPMVGREEPRDVGKGPGVTGVALLYESHCVIHTYPKASQYGGWFLFELVSCKPFDPNRILTLLKDWAGASEAHFNFSHAVIGHLFPDSPV